MVRQGGKKADKVCKLLLGEDRIGDEHRGKERVWDLDSSSRNERMICEGNRQNLSTTCHNMYHKSIIL